MGGCATRGCVGLREGMQRVAGWRLEASQGCQKCNKCYSILRPIIHIMLNLVTLFHYETRGWVYVGALVGACGGLVVS